MHLVGFTIEMGGKTGENLGSCRKTTVVTANNVFNTKCTANYESKCM